MSHRCLPAAAALAGAWVLSCSGGDGRVVPDAGGHTAARLSVVVTAPRAGTLDGAAPPGAHPEGDVTTSAHLLRFRDIDAERAQLLAGGSPAPADFPAAGRCARVDAEARVDEALATLSPEATVEMLDAGNLVFRAAGRAVALSPRYLPELLPFVTGAAYDGERSGEVEGVDSPLELDQPGEAWASAAGGDDVGRFEVEASLPAVPWITATRADGGVYVAWTAAPRAAGGDDTVVLSVDGPGGTLRCRAADNGGFVIPWSQLGSIAGGDDLTLSVERSTRAPFAAAGLDAGELVVTVRDVVPLTIDE